jgi:parallel beta-helix repeat protein
VFSGDGITVNAPGAIVVLRGLSINGQGGNRGVFFQAGARLRIENCVISSMSVAGISHNAASGEMIVLDTVVRDNTGSGIVVGGDVPVAVLDHVRSEHNGGDGLNVAPTGGSIGVLVTVTNSLFTRNEGRGIGAGALPGATLTIVVERSVMSYNGQDGVVTNSTTGATAATLTRNMINDNGGHGIWLQGNTKGTASENALHRNSGNGIRVEGDTFSIYLSANSAVANLTLPGIVCFTAGTGAVSTLGNNMGDGASFACAYSPNAGF